MKINYYRHPNAEGESESWENCQFDSNTDLSSLTVKHLVTINGQPFLRQHHLTYLTGKETCHAHHFAKLLATKLLAKPSTTSKSNCKVLWIDTLHGPHVCAKIYYELIAHATDKENLHFICLDILGSQRQNFYAINRNIEYLIKQYDPELVIIDDIDHFMPFCGVNTANEFCHIIRDVINHTETAFLCIGYNHLGKKASTTGNLGKYLFLDATDVFGLSTQGNVTTVRLVNSYDMSCLPDDSQFRFTIGTDNFPHEASTASTNKQDQEAVPTKDSNNQDNSEINPPVNTSLTLPTPPSTQQSSPKPAQPSAHQQPRPVCGGAATATTATTPPDSPVPRAVTQ